MTSTLATKPSGRADAPRAAASEGLTAGRSDDVAAGVEAPRRSTRSAALGAVAPTDSCDSRRELKGGAESPYGLGLEALWNGGLPGPMTQCGIAVLGHGGEDYGSGSPLAGYMPQLGLGISLAMTSARLDQAGPAGMNCSIGRDALQMAPRSGSVRHEWSKVQF